MPTTTPNIVVGFDLDGVIIDHTQNKMQIALRYGIQLTPAATHAEHMGAHFTPEMYREIKTQLYDSHDSTDEALAAPLMQGAFDALATLKERGIPYFLVSLQKNPMHAAHLLEQRGLWGTYFTPENTFFAKNAEEKYAIAMRLGVTHFVDDEPNVLDIMHAIPERILFDARSLFPEKTAYLHVQNWGEAIAALGVLR
jgi:phosphoglycolate phosphatase-like HAD superfamily hydrolase